MERDIIERLRQDAKCWLAASHSVSGPRTGALECEAADEIERLQSMLGNSELAVAELLEQIKRYQQPT